MHKLISAHYSIRNSPWTLALIHRDKKVLAFQVRNNVGFFQILFKNAELDGNPCVAVTNGQMGAASCPGATQIRRAKSSHQL
jgi:hypothetical protein